MTAERRGRIAGFSPPVLLLPEHVPTVRTTLERNPGIALRKLTPLVQSACGLASMNIATLHRFIEQHQLPRIMDQHSAARARRRAAK